MCPHVPLKPNHIFVLSQSIKRANTRNFCVEIKRRQLHLLLFFSHKVMSDSLWPHGLQPARLLCLWDSPGKNTGVGCHFLLQGIFPTQGSNLNQSLALAGRFFPTAPPGKPQLHLLAFILNMKSSQAWWQWSNKMQTKKTDELTALLYTNWNFTSGKKKEVKTTDVNASVPGTTPPLLYDHCRILRIILEDVPRNSDCSKF